MSQPAASQQYCNELYQWFLAQLRRIGPHKIHRLRQLSFFVKITELTLPNSLETPKRRRLFTSTAAEAATTCRSRRKEGGNILNWHHCQDGQHLSHFKIPMHSGAMQFLFLSKALISFMEEPSLVDLQFYLSQVRFLSHLFICASFVELLPRGPVICLTVKWKL